MNKVSTKFNEKIDNSDRLAQLGLSIVHINNYHSELNRMSRSMTIAYEKINRGKNYRLSVAVLHKADIFSKKQGTKAALDNWESGQNITIPVDPRMKPASQFNNMFGFIR